MSVPSNPSVLPPWQPEATADNVAGVSAGLLLVDDEREFLALARELLGREARIVGEARTGDEAFSMLLTSNPEIAIVDVQLGRESGFELARRLLEHAPTLRVVMVSADDHPGYQKLSRSVGAAGFLPKKRLSLGAIESVLAEPV